MSTKPRTFTLTREQVYDLVWTRPIQQLAREWGLSDVGLAKILNRMAIPRPGRGYWAKVAAGEIPKRPRLPVVRDASEVLRVFRSPLADQPKADLPVVHVHAKLAEPHGIVRWLMASFDKAPADEHGRRRIGDKYHAPLCVRAAAKDRALRMFDAVIKVLVARGNEVAVGPAVPAWFWL